MHTRARARTAPPQCGTITISSSSWRRTGVACATACDAAAPTSSSTSVSARLAGGGAPGAGATRGTYVALDRAAPTSHRNTWSLLEPAA